MTLPEPDVVMEPVRVRVPPCSRLNESPEVVRLTVPTLVGVLAELARFTLPEDTTARL